MAYTCIKAFGHTVQKLFKIRSSEMLLNSFSNFSAHFPRFMVSSSIRVSVSAFGHDLKITPIVIVVCYEQKKKKKKEEVSTRTRSSHSIFS